MAMNGKKRQAEDDLHDDQRFAKRFDLLNLEQNSKLYLPVKKALPNGPPRAFNHNDDESMQVDDTKDRVYIHNLDEELADIESDEEKLVFLPDIEKKLGKIPKSVLLSESHPSIGNEVVLYGVPTSLSIPEDQDKVKKAIIESRARAREKQVHDAEAEQVNGHISLTTSGLVPKSNGIATYQETEEDEDAMDLG